MKRKAEVKLEAASNPVGMPATHAPAPHLTEDELDEVLIAGGPADAVLAESSRVHLAGCAQCQSRCDEFHTSLAHFNQASMAWSEARSNTLTRDLAEVAQRQRGWQVPNGLLATVSAALLAAAGLMMTNSSPWHNSAAATSADRRSSGNIVGAVGARDAASNRAAASGEGSANGTIASDKLADDNIATDNIATDNIATDNAMLNAIDSALSTPEPSPLELYRTSAENAAVHRAPNAQGVNE